MSDIKPWNRDGSDSRERFARFRMTTTQWGLGRNEQSEALATINDLRAALDQMTRERNAEKRVADHWRKQVDDAF